MTVASRRGATPESLSPAAATAAANSRPIVGRRHATATENNTVAYRSARAGRLGATVTRAPRQARRGKRCAVLSHIGRSRPLRMRR